MSKLKQKSQENKAAAENKKEIDGQQSVKMKFKNNEYLHPLDEEPKYRAGETYEITGAASIHYWEVRGAVVVEGEVIFPEQVSDPTIIVPNEHTLDKPFGSEPEQVANDVKLDDVVANDIPLDHE